MKTQQLQLVDQAGTIASFDAGVRNDAQGVVTSQVKEPKTSISINPLHELESSLQRIFPTQQEDTRIQRVRQIMGDVVRDISDEELQIYLTEFQYLIDTWLDSYEKQIFEGRTLEQLLKEG